MPPDGDEVVSNGGPANTAIQAGAPSVSAAFHAEGVLQSRDASFATGTPGATALEPPLTLVRDSISSAVPRPGKDWMSDTHLDEATLAAAGEEAPVGRDRRGGAPEDLLMKLDGGDQQGRVSSSFVDGDVTDDAALGLLDLHQHSEFRRAIELSLADDLRPRLEDADDLARRARLRTRHTGAGLSDHLATVFRRDRDRADQGIDDAAASVSYCMHLLLRLLGSSLGLAHEAAGDAQQATVWFADGALRPLAAPT